MNPSWISERAENGRRIFFMVNHSSIYCSQIIVVHVHATVFFFWSSHSVSQYSKPYQTRNRSYSKNTNKHTADCSKAVCCGVKWSMWAVFIVHTTMWPKVSVSLIKRHFCLYRIKFMQVKAFERYIPLNIHIWVWFGYFICLGRETRFYTLVKS